MGTIGDRDGDSEGRSESHKPGQKAGEAKSKDIPPPSKSIVVGGKTPAGASRVQRG